MKTIPSYNNYFAINTNAIGEIKRMDIKRESSAKIKQRIGYSLFSTKVKMDKEDNFRNCPYGFVYK